uniref:Uncharacterized protein n=1 Tax=Mycena chlorophos TaxID=658473 RepID=A0ABQ0L2P3_MYCCL|nr:predicted protein [Mycena chlorophos]
MPMNSCGQSRPHCTPVDRLDPDNTHHDATFAFTAFASSPGLPGYHALGFAELRLPTRISSVPPLRLPHVRTPHSQPALDHHPRRGENRLRIRREGNTGDVFGLESPRPAFESNTLLQQTLLTAPPRLNRLGVNVCGQPDRAQRRQTTPLPRIESHVWTADTYWCTSGWARRSTRTQPTSETNDETVPHSRTPSQPQHHHYDAAFLFPAVLLSTSQQRGFRRCRSENSPKPASWHLRVVYWKADHGVEKHEVSAYNSNATRTTHFPAGVFELDDDDDYVDGVYNPVLVNANPKLTPARTYALECRVHRRYKDSLADFEGRGEPELVLDWRTRRERTETRRCTQKMTRTPYFSSSVAQEREHHHVSVLRRRTRLQD